MFTLRKLTLAIAITGLLSTPLLAATPAPQPVRILASLPITYGLSELLLKDSGVTLERAAAANLPGSRQSAYFSGRGAPALQKLAENADAVDTHGLQTLPFRDDPLVLIKKSSKKPPAPS